MKPVQYAQVSYFAHFSRLHYFFLNFEINEYFLFFLFHFLGCGWGWGWGVAVEEILEEFISEIESFHIFYFYFHRSITQKLNLSQ